MTDDEITLWEWEYRKQARRIAKTLVSSRTAATKQWLSDGRGNVFLTFAPELQDEKVMAWLQTYYGSRPIDSTYSLRTHEKQDLPATCARRFGVPNKVILKCFDRMLDKGLLKVA